MELNRLRRSLLNPLFHPFLLVHLQKNGYHKKTVIFNYIVLVSQNDQSNINDYHSFLAVTIFLQMDK